VASPVVVVSPALVAAQVVARAPADVAAPTKNILVYLN